MSLKLMRHFALLHARLAILCASVLLCCAPAAAQFVAADLDWKEIDAAPPPAFELRRLVSFDVSSSTNLKWGIDPDTVVIANDSTVRYVVVAQSPSGVINAMYEVIRCNTAEWKTYARFNKDSGWSKVADAQWQSLAVSSPSRYALRLAQQGVCTGAAVTQTVRDMVRYLKQGGPNQ
jgi:CNP1-like family